MTTPNHETSREWRERQEKALGDRQRPGAVATVGKRVKLEAIKQAILAKATARHGLHTVLRALRVHDTALLEFCGWFHDIERQAREDRLAAGGPAQGPTGSRDGVMMTRAMRLSEEVPVLLERLMRDPYQVLRELDEKVP